MKSQKPTHRFAKSHRAVYSELKPDEACCLKNHYYGALREVVGYLDKKADQDETGERFVWAQIETIIKRCHRYKKTVTEKTREERYEYKPRIVKYVVAELRKRNIISKRVVRVRDGEEKTGVVVAPHDCLAVRESDTKCVFHGQIHSTDSQGKVQRLPAGRWARGIILRDSDGNPLPAPEIGPVYWAGYSNSALDSAHNGAPHCAHKSALHCALRCAHGDSPQPNENEKVECENRRLTESVVESVKAEPAVLAGLSRAVPTESGQGIAEKHNPNSNPVRVSSSSTTDFDQKQTPETIAQHFSRDRVDMDEITDGEYEETEIAEQEDETDLSELLAICDNVISEWGNRLYLGRKTKGDIMVQAMVRFTKKHGEKVPMYWYPIAKNLRESARRAPTIETTNTDSGIAGGSLLASLLKERKIIRADYEWETKDGTECWDWIQKNAPERLTKQGARDLLLANWRTLPKLLRHLHEWFNVTWKG